MVLIFNNKYVWDVWCIDRKLKLLECLWQDVVKVGEEMRKFFEFFYALTQSDMWKILYIHSLHILNEI